MRAKLLALGLAFVASTAFSYAHVVGVPTALTATVMVQGKRPTVYLAWTDTAAALVNQQIRRRSTGTAADTIWRSIGNNVGKISRFEDPYVLVGRKYIYAVRDSIAGVAYSAWSDTAYVTPVIR